MAELSKTSFAQSWLNNFPPQDRDTASLLLDRIMLVGASEFIAAITKQMDRIERECQSAQPCLALYAEREIEKCNYDVIPFFPRTGKGRATGDGIPPVSVDLKKQDVGSEGIIAALISKYCKVPENYAISHPGPDALRENRVRKIVIVTDFVGSGRRINEMLDAFALVASIQSWRSYGLLDFHVVCYSGTELGLHNVRRHSLRPKVSFHIACPVINEAFSGSEFGAIKLLCKTYPGKRSRSPFGFNDTGALIAFSHGIPNNAPAILHSHAGGWKPLFPGRSTASSEIDRIADSSEMLAKNSERVLRVRAARKLLSDSEGELWTHAMLVLDAIRSGAKTPTKVSALTQIPIERVEEVIALSQTAGWVTPKRTLTRMGRREIRGIRKYFLIDEEFAFPESNMYFPSQLRAP